MSAPSPGRLHVITDETLQGRFTHVQLGELAARAGADVVQLREKRAVAAEGLVRVARELQRRLGASGTRLVVDDRVDVAAAVGAGVHLGALDAAPERARRRLGGAALIGATANVLERAIRMDREPVDYLGVGPVYGTLSKSNPAPELGLDGLRRIAAAVERPVIAIGGLTPDRVAGVLDAGAHGVAVLSDVVCSEDPAASVAAFRGALDRELGAREGR